MTRLCSALLCLAAAAAPARAHFIWVLPADNWTVRVVFSDTPKPDDPALLAKIVHTQLTVRGADGTQTKAELKPAKDALEAAVPGRGLREVAALCQYGVMQRGKSEPFLLNYYAKGFVGLQPDRGVPALFWQSWDKLPLEIVPVEDKGNRSAARVLWQGKPLAGAEYVVLVPGKDKPVEGKSDADGLLSLPKPAGGGVYGIRVKHTEAREGELGGKKYKEVRHYATLTIGLPQQSAFEPEATKLLRDARAARALYDHFPGFTADVEVNIDGTITRGQVAVNAKGKVQLDLGSAEEAQRWAKGLLGSIIAHRLDSGSTEDTPCAFADDDAHNPLGRAIRVLNDEFLSSYRIRDRQVIVVNRRMKDSRFTITVLENRLTEEKKFLPVSYVVNTWDLKADTLKRSEAHHQTWHRVGAYDLPHTALVVTASGGKQEARSLTLSSCKLSAEKSE
jgi:hypothetical protein